MLSSFFSGISGLIANSQAINVVSNNIANVNTVGYKAARAAFQDVLYQSILGSSGTTQVGRGTTLSSVDTLFSQGSFESTSVATDLAIGGNGFFIVRAANQDTNYYTRAGEFSFNKDGYLTTANGDILQGRQIDRTTNAPFGVDTDVMISQTPSQPRATQAVQMDVNLESSSTFAGNIDTSLGGAGTAITQATLSSGGYPTVGDYTMTLSGGNTLTVAVANRDASGALTGTTTTYTGTVAAGTTYTDFGDDGTGNCSGLDITTATGLNFANGAQTMQVQGFSTDYVSASRNPSTTSNYSTSVTAYDSLGQAHVVTVYFRKASTDATTQTSAWQWMAELSAADSSTGVNTLVGSGTLTFNSKGALTAGGTPPTLSVDFSQNADPGQSIDLAFTGSGGTTTQYPIASTTSFETQDGYPPGVLQSVSVATDGTMSGTYSNGQILALYQITLASFNNPSGLTREGGNLYSETLASGVPFTNAPGEGGLGKINANSLEQSNVDLATEFVKMIVAERGFQANAKVITTSDEVLQELMNLKR
jgi:flagellar hook protein FlgE